MSTYMEVTNFQKQSGFWAHSVFMCLFIIVCMYLSYLSLSRFVINLLPNSFDNNVDKYIFLVSGLYL